MSGRRLVHLTTTDMSLVLLLGTQLRAFRNAGYDVIGVSAAGEYVPRLEEWGIQHVPLRHATRAMAPHRDVAAYRELRGVLGRLRPTILHTHNPKPGLFGRAAGRRARVPVVVNTVHGLYATPDDPWLRRTVVYGLERTAARWSDAELVQNPEDVATLTRLGVPPEKLHVLGNGVDLARFRPTDAGAARALRLREEWGVGPDDVVVGAVGRLVAEKGYPELFRAMAAVRATRPDVRLVVVGPRDPDKGDAVSPDQLAAAERAGVVFAGARDDMEDVYAAMDLYVLASHREGFPRSAMEAAAMGLPVVATDIRGCRQVVDTGVTGILVPVRDVEALAGAVGALADDPDRRAAMGRAAVERAAEQFDERRVIATTLGVYDQLMAAQVSPS